MWRRRREAGTAPAFFPNGAPYEGSRLGESTESMKTLMPLGAFLLSLAPITARTWTSTDGRELEVEYVSKSDTKVKWNADGKQLTIPPNIKCWKNSI